MNYTYKKSKDGYHFYRVGETILHVFHIKNDATITETQEQLTVTNEFKKDDFCINFVHEIFDDRDNTIECSQEEFENKIREVIMISGIYEFTQVKQ